MAVMVGSKRVGVGPQASQIGDGYIGTQVAPTTPGTTDFAAFGGGSGSQAGGDYTDQFGNRFRYLDYGNGTGEWMQVLNNGQLARPSDAGEVQKRQAGTSIAGNGSGALPYGATQPVTPNQIHTAQTGIAQNEYNALLNDSSLSSNWDAQNKPWQDLIQGATGAAVAGRNQGVSNQVGALTGYAGSLSGLYGQQQGYVNQANAADQAALGQYNSIVNPAISSVQGLQAPTWQNYASNPQDIQRQQQAYDWAAGAAGGSLDYQAQLAGYQNASYQNASYQTYDPTHAQLYQYASNPQDVQRQLTGLGNIEQDIAHGGDGQRQILAQIYKDLQSGGDGQRDAISRLQQELATGGNDQREVMEKYKALSNPEVTAQERYLAEIARRSFEAQDKSNREAQMSDLSARGIRSGGAEIAGNLANQERLGQDRTLAELGLQANAVGRSMQALGGWQQSADSLRAAQQNGLAMYTQAQNALRAAQQNGMGMAANEENALRQAQQQGLAMYQQAADSIRAMNDQVGLSNTGWANQNSMFNANADNQANQFNANAYNENSMFNANAYNQNQQFNANAYNTNQIANAGFTNQASANNQNARLQGGISMNNTANSIRSANDAIGMFNTQGSQTSQLAAANFGLSKAQTLGGLAQTQFTNSTGASDAAYGRNSGLTSLGVSNATSLFGAQTTTNGIQAGAGSQNLGDIINGYNAWSAPNAFSTGLKQTENQQRLTAAATRALGPRPGVL